MEDTLRAREYAEQHDLSIVLILVLMEDILRDFRFVENIIFI